MDQLISWLITRLQFVYGFFVDTLGTPPLIGIIVSVGLVFLFFYSLFDLYRNRNKGDIALLWLVILLLVPLSTIAYVLFGSSALHAAPVHTPKGYVPVSKANVNTNAQKKYFLGTTTALGSVIATIALVAGLIALAFFVLIVIAYIQCLNDPKCM